MSETESSPAPTPASRAEVAAWILTSAGLLFVFRFHLVPAVAAGLLVHTLLHRTARILSGPRLSHGAAKLVAAGLMAIAASAVTAGVVFLLIGLVRGRVGDLPALLKQMAEALDEARGRLQAWGVGGLVPGALPGTEDLRSAFADWLREHAAELRTAGGEVGRFLVHALMGIVVALLVFFRHPEAPAGRFGAALSERASRIAAAFETVVLAQVEISALNTFLTGVYLFGVLPLFGRRLPLSGTLLIVTFVAGLIPVVGNLVSNTVIVVLSLGVSPWVALGSLAFLVVIHKLEYFVNAKIVGSRIKASAWEILLSIIVFEAAFGVPGVVLAPVLYAYAKKEIVDRGLI